jgi:uncharacterized short protein YbdD (DUF466 family)
MPFPQVFRDPNAPTMTEDEWFRDQQVRLYVILECRGTLHYAFSS